MEYIPFIVLIIRALFVQIVPDQDGDNGDHANGKPQEGGEKGELLL